MKYVNANTLLPAVLVEELQGYIQGGYIYVPVRQDQPKHWGELSGYREELEKRNREIIRSFKAGDSMEYLAEKYYFSSFPVFLNCSRESREVPEFIVPTLIEKNTNFFG